MPILKHCQRLFRLFFTGRSVDRFKVMGHGFAFTPGHERQAVADEMNIAAPLGAGLVTPMLMQS